MTTHRTAARRAYDRRCSARRRYLVGTGRWETPFIDAEPARQHVLALQAAGLSWAQIAEMAGLDTWRVAYLLRGAPHAGRPPQRRLRPNVAAALLAVSPVPRRLPTAGSVDGTGTRRRLQALATLGWSMPRVGREAGVSGTRLYEIATGHGMVRASTARAVRAAYDRLWDRPGGSPKTRTMARRNGWLPPAAWDDDTIDNPAAKPTARRRRTPRRTARTEGSR